MKQIQTVREDELKKIAGGCNCAGPICLAVVCPPGLPDPPTSPGLYPLGRSPAL